MQAKKICILGGSGFVGKHLASRLNTLGHQVKILSRHPQRHRDILVLPGVRLAQANAHDDTDLQRELTGMDVVINLIGILNEPGHDGSGFQAAHVDIPAHVVSVCKQVGVPRLLHMSAINAGVLRSQAAHQNKRNRGSDYLRTKGEGEQHVLAASDNQLAVTVFRPSLIFGRGDGIFGRFANSLTLTPVLPLACPNARFAPVYVGDVIEAFVRAMDDPDSFGKAYDLYGPRTCSLRQLIEYTARLQGLKRHIISLGPTLSRWQANIAEYLPGKPFSRDNYRSLQSDSTPPASYQFPFGIEPTTVESIVPLYFGNNTTRGRYMEFRSQAGR